MKSINAIQNQFGVAKIWFFEAGGKFNRFSKLLLSGVSIMKLRTTGAAIYLAKLLSYTLPTNDEASNTHVVMSTTNSKIAFLILAQKFFNIL